MSVFQLANGNNIPAIGLGTFRSGMGQVENAVEIAIKAGYRHLDLAFIYRNQEEVAVALNRVIPSVVRRDELFITSKLWNSSHRPSDVEKELDLTLRQLGLEYLDLYLMHWPFAFKPNSLEIDPDVTVAETWKAMHALLKTRKVKSIGVSNFTVAHLKELISATGIKPTVNQVELHPYLLQDDLLEYSEKENIHLTAYFPIGGQAVPGRPSLLNHSIIQELAAKYESTPAQVLLSWGVSRGYSVIPKSITPDRIVSNLKTIKLSNEDHQRVRDIGKDEQRRFSIPANYPPTGWNINVFGTPEERNTKHRVQISVAGANPRL